MPIPTSTFPWATSAGAGRVVPTTGKRASGFSGGEEPASEIFNEKFYNDNLWYEWLNTITPAPSAARDSNVVVDSNGDLSSVDFLETTEAGGVRHDARRVSVAPIGQFTNANFSSAGYAQATSAGATLDIPLTLIVGKEISGLFFRTQQGVGGTITMRLYESNGGTQTQKGILSVTPTTSWLPYATTITPFIVAADSHYTLSISMSTTQVKVAAPSWTEQYDGD